ncbi:MAG: hypothetical protein ACXW1P_09930 [Methylophilaceae bacterium]
MDLLGDPEDAAVVAQKIIHSLQIEFIIDGNHTCVFINNHDAFGGAIESNLGLMQAFASTFSENGYTE